MAHDEDDISPRGRSRIPSEDKRWFAQIIKSIINEANQPQIAIAEVLGVSRPWLSRAKKGEFGPWTRSVFEQKMSALETEGMISEVSKTRFLSEYGFHHRTSSTLPFMHITPVDVLVDIENRFRSHVASSQEILGDLVPLPETSEAITALRRGRRFILIIGPQSSGKSILARLVSKLLTTEMKIYFLDARAITDAAKIGIAEEVQRISDGRNLLVVEDAHLNPQGVNALLEGVMQADMNFLITTRPSYKDQILWNQRNVLALIEGGQAGHVIRLEPQSHRFKALMQEIVRRQLRMRCQVVDPAVTAEIIALSGNDLWALTSLAQASDGTNVRYDAVYNALRDRLVSLGREMHSAPSSILVIALFWQYEFPTPRDFLNRSLGVPREETQFLIDNGYVTESSNDGLLSLAHPSLAALLLQTADQYPNLWSTVRKKEPELSVSEELFVALAKYEEIDISRLFRQIRYQPVYIERCLSDRDIQARVQRFILSPKQSLFEAAEIISDIALYGSELVRTTLINGLTPAALKSRLDEEQDLDGIAHFLESFPWKKKTDWQATIESANQRGVVVGASSQERKDKRLVYCSFTAPWGSRRSIEVELRKIASDKAEPSSTEYALRSLLQDSQLCCKSGDVPTMCLKGAFHLPSDFCISLLQSLDEGLLASKLSSPSANASSTAKLLSVIAWTDQRLATRLLSAGKMEKILDKVTASSMRDERNMLLWAVHYADPLNFEKIAYEYLPHHLIDDYKAEGWLNV